MTFSEQDDQTGTADQGTTDQGTTDQTGDQGTTDQTGDQGTTDQTGDQPSSADPANTAPAKVAENSPVSVGEIPDDPAVLAEIDTNWSTDTEVA
jgi:hypothetical protein